MLDVKKEFGNIGEDVATKYLENMDYKIIVRNFTCKNGEIDIIAKDKDEFVFVEVKTRKSLNCGTPAESVDESKIKHICRTADYFLYKSNNINAFCRFDVIEVYYINNKFIIKHLKNVICR